MADESNWQNDIKSPQRGSVSANVNERRYGRVETPAGRGRASSRSSDEEQPDPNERAQAEGFEDKWQARFSHLPGVEPTGDSS